MMKAIIMAIALIGAAWSFSVQPDYGGVQDTGFEKLPALNVGIRIDCDTNSLAVTVKGNDTNQPIEGATAYLFYTNYGYQPLSNGKTNGDGVAAVPVTGKKDFLTSMFVLRTDAAGYRSREIEFTYKKCLEPPPVEKPPAKPPANQTAPPIQNMTNTTQNVTKNDSGNSTAQVSNVTVAVKENKTGNQTAAPAPQKGTCLPGFLLPLLAYIVLRK
jgi:hypothetical protein